MTKEKELQYRLLEAERNIEFWQNELNKARKEYNENTKKTQSTQD